MNAEDTQIDIERDFEPDFAERFFAADEQTLDVQVAAATHTGKLRDRNEDHYAVVRRTRRCEMLFSNLPNEDVATVADCGYGLLVADGVGGADFGDFASQLAIETMLQDGGLATSWVMKYKDLDSQELRERIGAYVDRIQSAFQSYVQTDPAKRRMGTTLTAAYLIPPHGIITHIGDSRAYIFRDGFLKQITHDHTLAQALIDSGAKKEKVEKLGHVLMNSLGGVQDNTRADVIHIDLKGGDRLLLCTDGLSDMVEKASIVAALKAEGDLQSVCDNLVELALEGGGSDNITVIVCDLLPANA